MPILSYFVGDVERIVQLALTVQSRAPALALLSRVARLCLVASIAACTPRVLQLTNIVQ